MIFQLLTKIHQNQFFIYLYGFKHLVLYNLVVCYSLHPDLVIWYVTLIIFMQIQVYFSKLKRSLVSPNWVMKIGKNNCPSPFLCNLC